MIEKILFVAGAFDEKEGAEFKLAEKMYNELKEIRFPNCKMHIDFYNGGNISELEEIKEKIKNAQLVLWWAETRGNRINVKQYNKSALLVTAKYNASGKYSPQTLVRKALLDRANLCVEIYRENDNTNYRLFDALGNQWYAGFGVEPLCYMMLHRLSYLEKISRNPTNFAKERVPQTPDEVNFIASERLCSERLNSLIDIEEKMRFYISSSSFRYKPEKYYESYNDLAFVSRRYADGTTIENEEYMPVILSKNDDIVCLGDAKPAIDTYIHLKLYKSMPQINFIYHSHGYVKNKPFVEDVIPCGGTELYQAIVDVLKRKQLIEKDYIVINLKGHGSYVMGKDAKLFKGLEFYARPLFEEGE